MAVTTQGLVPKLEKYSQDFTLFILWFSFWFPATLFWPLEISFFFLSCSSIRECEMFYPDFESILEEVSFNPHKLPPHLIRTQKLLIHLSNVRNFAKLISEGFPLCLHFNSVKWLVFNPLCDFHVPNSSNHRPFVYPLQAEKRVIA